MRRWREGMCDVGRVVNLETKDTREEAYLYSARRKERKMHQELDRLRKELKQRILVGEPRGETFVAAVPLQRIELLRDQARRDSAPVLQRAKTGQTTFEEYGAGPEGSDVRPTG